MEGKISQFLSNLLFLIQALVKAALTAHGVITSLEVSDGTDSHVGLPGLADLFFYSQVIWSDLLSSADQRLPDSDLDIRAQLSCVSLWCR